MSNPKFTESEPSDRSNWIADLDREVIEKASHGLRLRPPLRVIETQDHPEREHRQAA